MASSGSSSQARMSVRFPEAQDQKGTESTPGSSPSVLDLPTEMLQRVFQLLPLADMHSVVQVGSQTEKPHDVFVKYFL